jgi:hypothetical protein
MSNDPFGQGAGTAESFIAQIQSAPTPSARTAALSAYEQFMMGGSGAQAAPGAPLSSQASWSAPVSPLPAPPLPPPNADAIAAATEKAFSASTPMAKQRALEELEALHRAGSGEPPGEPAAALPEGFEPPRSPLEYQLVPPKGIDIQNDEALGDLKSQLFDAGIPAAVAGQAFANAARMFTNGVLASPEAYDAAVLQCKGALEKQFGSEARRVALDGTAYLNALAARSPALGEHVTLMLADPWAVATAANLQRAGHMR